MHPIPVAHIRDSGGIFGAERVILTIGKNIGDRYEVMLILLRSPDGKSDLLRKEAEERGIKVVSVDVRGKLDLSAIREIREILEACRIKIMHSHDFKGNLYGLIASRGLGIRRILTDGGTTRDSLSKKIYVSLNEAFTYRFFDRIVAVSHEIHRKITRKLGNSEKLSVIENGIDESLYEAGAGTEDAEPLPVDGSGKVFAVIGRLYPDKGHRYFIEAFSGIRKEFPSAVALIIGEGPSEEEIRKQVRELGLEDSVKLCGVRKDMMHVYRNTDFLVLPSLTEGLPYVLLEAMLFKVPILATNVGGIPNIVIDGETGYLVPPADVPSLKSGMEKLLRNPEKNLRIAEEGHRFVTEKYSARRMASGYTRLYDSMINPAER